MIMRFFFLFFLTSLFFIFFYLLNSLLSEEIRSARHWPCRGLVDRAAERCRGLGVRKCPPVYCLLFIYQQSTPPPLSFFFIPLYYIYFLYVYVPFWPRILTVGHFFHGWFLKKEEKVADWIIIFLDNLHVDTLRFYLYFGALTLSAT